MLSNKSLCTFSIPAQLPVQYKLIKWSRNVQSRNYAFKRVSNTMITFSVQYPQYVHFLGLLDKETDIWHRMISPRFRMDCPGCNHVRYIIVITQTYSLRLHITTLFSNLDVLSDRVLYTNQLPYIVVSGDVYQFCSITR